MTTPQAGQLVVRRVVKGVLGCDLTPGDSDYQLEIVHADPHILVTDEVLADIARHQQLHQRLGTPTKCTVMRLDPPPDEDTSLPGRPHLDQWTGPAINRHYHDFTADPWPCHPDPGAPCWVNWLLHIDASNNHLVYRIRRYDLQPNAWEASWPD